MGIMGPKWTKKGVFLHFLKDFISFSVKQSTAQLHSTAQLITTAQLHSTKPELRLCAGSSPARGVSEIRDGEDL